MQRYKTLCKFWPVKIAIQGKVLLFFFLNCNDCVNCGKNLEFKIKPLVGQVAFVQWSFLLQNLQMGMSCHFPVFNSSHIARDRSVVFSSAEKIEGCLTLGSNGLH